MGINPATTTSFIPIDINILIPLKNRLSKRKPDHYWQSSGNHNSYYYQPQPATYLSYYQPQPAKYNQRQQ